jgi:poly-beta-hydroxyalkanoate depolymerase
MCISPRNLVFDKSSNKDLDFFFFANRTLLLKETTNNTKHLKINENYNKILEKPFNFNLQTVSTACRRSSLNRPNVVGCRRKVTERIKKTISIPKTKKKDEAP